MMNFFCLVHIPIFVFAFAGRSEPQGSRERPGIVGASADHGGAYKDTNSAGASDEPKHVQPLATGETATRGPLSIDELSKVWYSPWARNLHIIRDCPQPGKHVVYFTFDDGPDGVETQGKKLADFVDRLKGMDVNATFFWVAGGADGLAKTADGRKVIAKMLQDGQAIEAHSMNHADLGKPDTNLDVQISAANSHMQSDIGHVPVLLRPPYGSGSSRISNYMAAHEVDQPIALWSIDTNDWRVPPVRAIEAQLSYVPNGAIILMHEGKRKDWVDVNTQVIQHLKDTCRDCVFESLEQCPEVMAKLRSAAPSVAPTTPADKLPLPAEIRAARHMSAGDIPNAGTADYEMWIRDPAEASGAFGDFQHTLFESTLRSDAMMTSSHEVGDYISRPKVHIITMGREGSSFMWELLTEAKIPSVFEPFNGNIEGHSILSDVRASARAECLYGLGDCRGLLTPKKKEELDAVKKSTAPLIGFKTERILKLDAFGPVAEMAKKQGAPLNVKFIVLFRDPRAVYNSAMKFPSWALSNVDFICKALDLKLNTLPSLMSAVGKENVLPLVFEHWAADLPRTLQKLQQFLKMDSMPEAWKKHATNDNSIGAWQKKLDAYTVQQIQTHPSCKHHMKEMNYPEGQQISYANTKRDF